MSKLIDEINKAEEQRKSKILGKEDKKAKRSLDPKDISMRNNLNRQNTEEE